MSFFNNSDWVGFLAENIIQKCVAMVLAECSGCKDSMKSDLLHLHQQLSLLEKIQKHFEEARGEALAALQDLYKEIESKLPHSDDVNQDRIIYCNVGRLFLQTCSPETLYYGRYVNELNHTIIHTVLEERKGKTKIQKSRKRKVAKPELLKQ